MMDARQIVSLATVLGAVGLWLLLPRGLARGRAAGAVLALAALGAWASQLPRVGDWLASGAFWVLAAVTIVSAAATVTFRSPVYCAIWFGMMLSGTAGLFMLAGAEFLAIATLVVYAGAILVTFLFVLMLAQPEGRTPYDRRSWEPMLSAATGAFLVGVLSMTVAGVMTSTTQAQQALEAVAVQEPAVQTAAGQGGEAGPLHSTQVAQLGAELFTRHLIAVEVAGTLLLAALVGASVIVAQLRTQGTQGNCHREHGGHGV